MLRNGLTSIVSTILFIMISVSVAGSTMYFVKDIQESEKTRVSRDIDIVLEDLSVISASDIRRCEDAQDDVEFLSRITGLASGAKVVLVGDNPEILVDYEDQSGRSFLDEIEKGMGGEVHFTAYGPLSSILFRLMDYSEILNFVSNESFVFKSAYPDGTYLIVDENGDGILNGNDDVYEYVTKTCGVHTYIIGEREPYDKNTVFSIYISLADGEGDDWWVENVVETFMFETEDELLADIRNRIASASSSVVLIGNTPTSISDSETLDVMEYALDRGVSVEAIGPITAEVIARVGPVRIGTLLWKGFVVDDTNGNVTDCEEFEGDGKCHEVAYVVVDGNSYKYMTGSPVYTRVVQGVNPVISASVVELLGVPDITFQGKEIVIDANGLISEDILDPFDVVIVSAAQTSADTNCTENGDVCDFIGDDWSAVVLVKANLDNELMKADPSDDVYDGATYNTKIAELALGKGSINDYIDYANYTGKIRVFLEHMVDKVVADNVEEVVLVLDANGAENIMFRDFGKILGEVSEYASVTIVFACLDGDDCKDNTASLLSKAGIGKGDLANINIKEYVEYSYDDSTKKNNVYYEMENTSVVRDQIADVDGTYSEDSTPAAETAFVEVVDNSETFIYEDETDTVLADAIDANYELADMIKSNILMDDTVMSYLALETYKLAITVSDKLMLSVYQCIAPVSPSCTTGCVVGCTADCVASLDGCVGNDDLYTVIKNLFMDNHIDIYLNFIDDDDTVDSDIDGRYGCMSGIASFCHSSNFYIDPVTDVLRTEFILMDQDEVPRIMGHLDDDGFMKMDWLWSDDGELIRPPTFVESILYNDSISDYIGIYGGPDSTESYVFYEAINNMSDGDPSTNFTGYLNGTSTTDEGYMVVKFRDKFDITSIYIEFDDDTYGTYRLHNANVQYSTDDDCSTWTDVGTDTIDWTDLSFSYPSTDPVIEDVRCLKYIGRCHGNMDSNPSFRIVEFDVTGYPSI